MLAAVIDCIDLDGEVAFLCEHAGFRIHLVSPADDPRSVVLEHTLGSRIEIRRSDRNWPIQLRVPSDDDRLLESPGGTVIHQRPDGSQVLEALGAEMTVPHNHATLSVVETTAGTFGVGRAGMEYRDLLPDRSGGRFIASHIRILDEGDVGDWVHFHRIRFQMIYVVSGWVDVVYEGQGEPFRMHAGDCVLQPPEIRHRVLRSSAGLEVIEIGSPAEHDTIADHDMVLPTGVAEPGREFWGQRFVRHVASGSALSSWIDRSLSARETGIGAATGGLAGAVVVSRSGDRRQTGELVHHGEFVMIVGLHGSARIELGAESVDLTPRSSVAVPAGLAWSWSDTSPDHQALVVTLPETAIEAV
ncbi:MAG: cupin domain-containing protein [Ilumatobacter sp.]